MPDLTPEPTASLNSTVAHALSGKQIWHAYSLTDNRLLGKFIISKESDFKDISEDLLNSSSARYMTEPSHRILRVFLDGSVNNGSIYRCLGCGGNANLILERCGCLRFSPIGGGIVKVTDLDNVEVQDAKVPQNLSINGQVFYPIVTKDRRNPESCRIFVRSSPHNGWLPGQEISQRTINNWLRKVGYKWDDTNKILVDRTTPTAWVIGGWKAKYKNIIERMLSENDESNENDLLAVEDILVRFKESKNKELEREKLTAVSEYQTLKTQLMEAGRKIDHLTKVLANVKEERTDVKKTISELTSLERIKSVTCSGSSIVLFTKWIYIDHVIGGKKRRGDIGEFKIIVNLDNGNVTITNLTRKVNNYEHPHVPSPGNLPCWGEVKNTIPDLVSKLRLVELARVLIAYLEGVDVQDSAGKNIVLWPCIDEKVVPPTPKKFKTGDKVVRNGTHLISLGNVKMGTIGLISSAVGKYNVQWENANGEVGSYSEEEAAERFTLYNPPTPTSETVIATVVPIPTHTAEEMGITPRVILPPEVYTGVITTIL